MKSINLKNAFFTVIILALVACANKPPVQELPPSSDPQAEINRVDENLKVAREKQVDILSPKSFESAEKARDKAVEARTKNKEQKTILYNVALSQAYLDQANATAGIGEQLLAQPLAARKAAIDARANTHYSKEMKSADADLRNLTNKIENKNTDVSAKKSEELVKTYKELQLKAVKKEKTGVAQANLEQAKKEGAKKYTPNVLAATERQIASEESFITNNLGRTEEINQASTRATVASERLLRMVRTAKTSASTNPEELALQAEKNEREVLMGEKALDQTELALARAQDRLSNQAEITKSLESQAWLDRQYDAATQEFSSEEAEVYKQGNKLLLRLKGLSFANGKADLTDKNYPLLTKVKKVIAEIEPTQITIEGHTDSVGAKQLNEALSEKRAQAVQAYLTADSGIDAAKINTEGFGDAKPITTNKTADGRAQNRRVDVVLTAEPITE